MTDGGKLLCTDGGRSHAHVPGDGRWHGVLGLMRVQAVLDAGFARAGVALGCWPGGRTGADLVPHGPLAEVMSVLEVLDPSRGRLELVLGRGE